MSSFMTYIEPKKYRAEIYCIAWKSWNLIQSWMYARRDRRIFLHQIILHSSIRTNAYIKLIPEYNLQVNKDGGSSSSIVSC